MAVSSGVDQGLGSAAPRPANRAGVQPQHSALQPANAPSASGKADPVAAATAAAAAALRPSKQGNGRSQGGGTTSFMQHAGSGKGLTAGHPQATSSHSPTVSGHPHAASGHPNTTTGSHGSLSNGIAVKASQQQQQQSKQANARTLNGNAAAFVPASVSGGMPSISSSLSLTSTGSETLNGHSGQSNHTSYRNAAAGVSTPASLLPPTTSMALSAGDKGGSSQESLSPRHSMTTGMHVAEAPSSPAPAVSKTMQNGDANYSLPRGKQSQQQSHQVPFTSPDAPKVCLACTTAPVGCSKFANVALCMWYNMLVFAHQRLLRGHGDAIWQFLALKCIPCDTLCLLLQIQGQTDSSGLEDFAHMGLIDDLLG